MVYGRWPQWDSPYIIYVAHGLWGIGVTAVAINNLSMLLNYVAKEKNR